MPAFMKVIQIEDVELRREIVDAIRRQTEMLPCDYEISMLRGGGNKDWDLVIKAPDSREFSKILYEEKGDLGTKVFETHLQELMKGINCVTAKSISRGILGE